MANNRFKTKYPGIFYRVVRRVGGKPDQQEKVFYAVWSKDGKIIEARCGYEFRDNMTAARASVMRGEFIEGKRTTRAEKKRQNEGVPTLNKLWIKYKEGQLTKKRTIASFQSDFNRIPDFIKNKGVTELSPKDIARADQEFIEKGYSPQTRKHSLALIGRIIQWAHTQQICQPLAFKIQFPRVDNKKTEFLTEEQFNDLLQALDADIDYEVAALVKFIINTGIRRDAAFSLEWTDIDFERNLITLRGETAKNDKTQIIPLSKQAKQILQTISRHNGTNLIFPSSTGVKRLKIPVAFERRIREKAKLPDDFRFLHGLRHTFASRLASSGKVDMYTLQKLLTHESPEMTQRYSHLLDEAFKRAAGAIDEIMTPHKDDK